ncbi:MarR family winged helix-turn-helix transcriptional regulator [Microlunatus sp. GCM10028923]|uniref:MarR family winged helix-turn-helix transcriptional regulator n=1 Tax=Microlunatus sp. GCM10028923 TaxID=3273400 RepID=UPI0036182ADB
MRETLSYRLARVGRAASNAYAARLQRLGLRPLHVRLLTAIASADRAPQNEHAAELGVTSGFVVRLADDLERLGAITRQRDAQDRRRQYLVLLPAGKSLLQEATQVLTELDQELARDLSKTALARLTASLDVVTATVTSEEYAVAADPLASASNP